MPHLTPPPQREAVGSTAGRPHLLSGSGEVPLSPLCSTPLRDPPEIRDTLGGVLRWLCGQRAPHVGSPTRASSSVRFAVDALHPPRPGRRCGAVPPPPAPLRGAQRAAKGSSARGRPERRSLPPSARSRRPCGSHRPFFLSVSPPPSPAVSPRHSPVPLPLRAAASHPLCHALSSPSPPNPLRTDAVGSKLNFSITAHLSYPGA